MDNSVAIASADDADYVAARDQMVADYDPAKYTDVAACASTNSLDCEAWAYQNQVRMDPRSLIPGLTEKIGWFNYPDEPLVIWDQVDMNTAKATTEGPAAYQEAIDFLSVQMPVVPLEWDDALFDSAQAHTDDIGATGSVSHDSTDGTDAITRIQSYFSESPIIAENLEFGSQQTGESPSSVIEQLIIDDGVPTRGHRISIFNPELGQAAISCGSHTVYSSMCTLTYGGLQ